MMGPCQCTQTTLTIKFAPDATQRRSVIMATQQTPPVLTELKLPPALKDTVNTALARGRMMSVAYVSPEGRPELSFRGSVQAYSDTQLAIWVRNPEGGILKAVTSGHPHITLLYGELNAQSKAFVTFRGRGRVDSSESTRRKVYDDSPEIERNMDKERKGVALIIDLDSVDGFFAGNALKIFQVAGLADEKTELGSVCGQRPGHVMTNKAGRACEEYLHG